MEERPISEEFKNGGAAKNEYSVEEINEDSLNNRKFDSKKSARNRKNPSIKIIKQNSLATGEENLTDERTVPDESERQPNEAIAKTKNGMSSMNQAMTMK